MADLVAMAKSAVCPENSGKIDRCVSPEGACGQAFSRGKNIEKSTNRTVREKSFKKV
jgi:hypothetical protein